MLGCAVSDDNADHLVQQRFREGRTKKCGLLAFRPGFPPNRRSFDMTNATHPYHALMDITARPQTVFVKGDGAYLWDDKGKRYLDFMQGWAVNCLGHSPAIVADALAAQAKLLLTPSPAFYNRPSLTLPKPLLANSAFDQRFFATSDAEATEAAIKLAHTYY